MISGVPKRAPSLAAEREAERAGQHVAVGGAQGGLAQLADQREQRGEALGGEVLVHERDVGGEAREVAARAEDLLVGGGEDDAAHGVIVAGAGERLDQLAEELVGEGVAVLGMVEGDCGDAAGRGVVAGRLEGHGSAGRAAHFVNVRESTAVVQASLTWSALGGVDWHSISHVPPPPVKK